MADGQRRMATTRRTGVLIAVAAAAVIGMATQEPARQTFHAATRLVQVSVVVHDRDGRPVAGLAPGDFTLYEDGKEQPIELFTIESDRAITPAPVPGAGARNESSTTPAAGGDFSNRSGGSIGGVTVILIDRLNTRFEDQLQVRDQIVQFLGTIRRDDRVALYVLESESVRVLHDFTSDATALLGALSRYRARTSKELEGTEAKPFAPPLSGDPSEDARTAEWLEKTTQRVEAFYLRNRVDSTSRALEGIANHLAGVRGRKNLVWVSSGFPFIIDDGMGPQTIKKEIDLATRAINNADVAIYPLDARGLMPAIDVIAATATREVMPGGRVNPAAPPPGLTRPTPNIETMQHIAEATGGRAFYNTNDISTAVRRAIDDSRMTYVLGYYPTHGKWDGRFRAVKVKVNRPGVDVRHRRGYLAIPQAASDPAKRQAELIELVRSPIEATGMGLTAHVARIEAQGKTASDVNVAIRLEGDAITLERKSDYWEGALDLVIAQSVPDGAYYKSFSTTVNLRFTNDQRDQLLQEGFSVNRTVTLRSDVYRLHVVVRDVPAGTTGSVIIPADKIR